MPLEWQNYVIFIITIIKLSFNKNYPPRFGTPISDLYRSKQYKSDPDQGLTYLNSFFYINIWNIIQYAL